MWVLFEGGSFSRKYDLLFELLSPTTYNIWYKILKNPHHVSCKNLTNFHTIIRKFQNPCLLPGCSTFFNGQKRLFFSVPAPLCASAGGHTLVDLWEEELHLSFWLEFGWVEGAELNNGAKFFLSSILNKALLLLLKLSVDKNCGMLFWRLSIERDTILPKSVKCC